MTACAPRFSRRARTLAALVAALLAAPLGAQQSQRAAEKPHRSYAVDTNEDLQPATLPTLPPGMTVAMLVDGDRLFHGRGGCFACHGADAAGDT